MPSTIEKTHRDYKDRGLAVVAINMEESRDKVGAWLRSQRISVPILLDVDGKVNGAYKVTATPTVFVLGRDGKVVGIAHGTKAWTGAPGRALLDALVTAR